MFGNDFLFLQRLLKSLGYYTGSLDGDFGPLTDEALQAFEEDTEKIANAHGRVDPRSEKNITTLHTKAQTLARQFMREVSSASEIVSQGVTVKLISGTRTYHEQSELFAQGRSKPGRIVTNAGPGKSNHNFGIAWDVGLFRGINYLDASPLYDTVGAIGKHLGLEWGGDWTSIIDKPHFQLRMEISLAEVKTRFESGSVFSLMRDVFHFRGSIEVQILATKEKLRAKLLSKPKSLPIKR